MENSILNDLIIDPGYILILMMAMIVILFVLQIKNSFKIDRFMKKYKSFMKGKDGVSLEKTILRNINEIDMLMESSKNHMEQIKQLKETIEMTPADRTDLLEEAQKRLEVLEEYAPKMMNAEEITAVINTVLSELGIETPSPKDKGKIMKELMPRVKGKADGKEVNQILASMMK